LRDGSMAAMERTLVIIKPDALQRGLAGEVISRFERKGLRIAALKLVRIDGALAERLYEPHKGKPFYEGLVRFMTSSPSAAAVLSGKDAVSVARRMMGATAGPEAAAGTIRGDFGLSGRFNLVHGSDSPRAAEREIGLFFDEREIMDYRLDRERWTYDLSGPDPL